jgi:integrase
MKSGVCGPDLRRHHGPQPPTAARLDGYPWHGSRHTFVSRLVKAGVDLLTVQTLGGWCTASLVQRYPHLAPGHLTRAVERLVDGVQLEWNLDGATAAVTPDVVRVV